MKVLMDTNVLISALIRDSASRKIIVLSGLEFYYPEISLHEVRKHEKLVMEKSGLSQEELAELFARLLKYIRLVPEGQVRERLEEAKAGIGHIDPDDTVFLAAALSLGDVVIWSEDRDFEGQKLVQILKTRDMLAFLEG